MMDNSKVILEKLNGIKSELDYIRKHMADVDTILTEDDLESLQEAEKDLKERKTKRL